MSPFVVVSASPSTATQFVPFHTYTAPAVRPVVVPNFTTLPSTSPAAFTAVAWMRIDLPRYPARSERICPLALVMRKKPSAAAVRVVFTYVPPVSAISTSPAAGVPVMVTSVRSLRSEAPPAPVAAMVTVVASSVMVTFVPAVRVLSWGTPEASPIQIFRRASWAGRYFVPLPSQAAHPKRRPW